jgi:hypothetical protein
MRNLWCLEKNSILPLIISATGKYRNLGNTLVVEIQKGIILMAYREEVP